MSTVLYDFLYSFRAARRNLVLTIAVALTLALGIGANTALFTVVQGVLLRPLPLPGSGQVTMLWETILPAGRGTVSLPDLKDWREQAASFESIAAYRYASFSFYAGEKSERFAGAQVSPNFFRVMGVQPLVGRWLTEGEDVQGADNAIVISEGLWRAQFGSEPDVIGRQFSVNGRKVTVVGIMPAAFRFPNAEIKVWAPLVPDSKWIRAEHNLFSVGRLKAGMTVTQSQAEMDMIGRHLASQYPENRGRGVLLIPLLEQIVGSIRQTLLILMVLVGLVFLMACTNIVNLLLTRTAARQRETSIRIAMGASRWRIIRLFLTENLVLAGIGGVLGWFIGIAGIKVLLALRPSRLPRIDEISPDTDVLLFTVLISFVAALALGISTSLAALRSETNEILKDSGRSSTSGVRSRWARDGITIAEVAMAFILLTAAGLTVASFARMNQVNPGFDSSQLLTMRMALPEMKYPDTRAAATFYEDLLQKLHALPGVQSAGMIVQLPLREYGLSDRFRIQDDPVPLPGREPRADYRPMSSDYHRAMRIPLRAGRYFSTGDTKQATPVAIVNETFVRQYFPARDPIGREIQVRGQPSTVIVGVVGDSHQGGLQFSPDPEIDVPYEQCANYALVTTMSFVIRTASDPGTFAPYVRKVVSGIDPEQVVFSVETMDAILAKSVGDRRFATSLTAAFGGVAWLLATLGLYGVMSYSVKRRMRELGIRMALGAKTSQIVRMVVGRGLLLATAGSVVGLLGALAAGRLMSDLLYGVHPQDPLILAGVLFTLILTAFWASYLPARRVLQVDPVDALRHE
jgi:putative ABC transport system permease protein